jgi:hypothetical protein
MLNDAPAAVWVIPPLLEGDAQFTGLEQGRSRHSYFSAIEPPMKRSI